MNKLIVTAAITGAVTIPTQTKYLPYTPDQMAEDAILCCKAGAAVIHVHTRDPKTGAPASDMEVFGEILRAIKARTDAVICTSTGGGMGMTPEDRIRVVPTWKPELASCNMGSINFSYHTIARRINDEDYKFSWEKPRLERSEDHIFANTFASPGKLIGASTLGGSGRIFAYASIDRFASAAAALATVFRAKSGIFENRSRYCSQIFS